MTSVTTGLKLRAFSKRLVVFADTDKQVGKLGKFLSLTGQDPLRSEEKNKRGFEFKYGGMVVVASNEPVFAGSSASRVKRRVVSVPFNNQVPAIKKRHNFDDPCFPTRRLH